MKSEKQSHFVRTSIRDENGEPTRARINLITGEIRAYSPNKKDDTTMVYPIAKADRNLDKDHFWMDYAVGGKEYPSTINKHISYRKEKINYNNIYLQQFHDLEDALEQLPALDDIFTGVCNLTDNGVSRSALFYLLKNLDIININTVADRTAYSTSHDRKVLASLIVLSNALDMLIEN